MDPDDVAPSTLGIQRSKRRSVPPKAPKFASTFTSDKEFNQVYTFVVVPKYRHRSIWSATPRRMRPNRLIILRSVSLRRVLRRSSSIEERRRRRFSRRRLNTIHATENFHAALHSLAVKISRTRMVVR